MTRRKLNRIAEWTLKAFVIVFLAFGSVVGGVGCYKFWTAEVPASPVKGN